MRLFTTDADEFIFSRDPAVTSIRSKGGDDHIECFAWPAEGKFIISGGSGDDFISGGIPPLYSRATLQVYGDDQPGPQGDDVMAMGVGAYNGRGGHDTYVAHGQADAIVRNFNVAKDTLQMAGQRFDVRDLDGENGVLQGRMQTVDVLSLRIVGIDRLNPITNGQDVYLARNPGSVLGQERIEDGDNGGVFATFRYNIERFDNAEDAFEARLNSGAFDWFGG